MLDVTVSQLLSLQPSLAARVIPKHRDVKESWARLQQALRWGSPRPGCVWLWGEGVWGCSLALGSLVRLTVP